MAPSLRNEQNENALLPSSLSRDTKLLSSKTVKFLLKLEDVRQRMQNTEAPEPGSF